MRMRQRLGRGAVCAVAIVGLIGAAPPPADAQVPPAVRDAVDQLPPEVGALATQIITFVEGLPIPISPCDPLVDPVKCLPLIFRIEAKYRTPEGEIHETTVEDQRMGVPSIVDVTGDALPDLLVQLQIDAGRATVRTSTLETAPDPLPVAVETILVDPRGGSDLRVAFGYDALEDRAPSIYDATLSFLGEGTVASFALDTHIADAGTTLAVTGAVFEEGPDRERVNPASGRIAFTPVPLVSHFDVLVGDSAALGQQGVNVIVDTPTKAEVTLDVVQGNDATAASIVLDQIPNSATLTYSNLETGQANLNYNATDRIGVIDVRASAFESDELVKDLTIRFEDMPLQATIVQDSPTHATLQATSPIGLVRVGLADDGVPLHLNDPAYVFATDEAGYDSLSFQLHDLSAAELGAGDPVILGATLRSEPLHVIVRDGAADLDAWIRDLPSTFRIEASTTGGTVSYDGSAVVGELTIDAHDPAGLVGRATDLSLLMRDIPTQLDLSFAPDNGTMTLDAGGNTLGLIEVQATNGPNNRLPANVDGVRLNDTSAGYELFGRVTGLRKVVAASLPQPNLELRTTGGRVFVIDLSEVSGSKVVYTRATLDSLPDVVTATVQGTNITYTASAPASSLVFDTNSGDRWNLHADVRNPLPASFSMCTASDMSCTPVADRGNRQSGATVIGSARMAASEHTTVNVFDCVRPLNANCTTSGATEFTRVNNMRVRVLGQDSGCNSSCERGWIYLDTDNFNLTGNIENRDAAGGGFRANFPSGFKAENRLGKWTLFGLSKNKSGTISCVSGTSLDVRLLGIWIGVTSYLC